MPFGRCAFPPLTLMSNECRPRNIAALGIGGLSNLGVGGALRWYNLHLLQTTKRARSRSRQTINHVIKSSLIVRKVISVLRRASTYVALMGNMHLSICPSH